MGMFLPGEVYDDTDRERMVQTIRGWRRCCPTAGLRRILRQSSPIGSTNPEPKPLALDPAALIAAPTANDAASSQPATMDWADAYTKIGLWGFSPYPSSRGNGSPILTQSAMKMPRLASAFSFTAGGFFMRHLQLALAFSFLLFKPVSQDIKTDAFAYFSLPQLQWFLQRQPSAQPDSQDKCQGNSSKGRRHIENRSILL